MPGQAGSPGRGGSARASYQRRRRLTPPVARAKRYSCSAWYLVGMARPQAPARQPDREALDLAHAAGLLLDECRMVLPGIQGLFGFQLIAVFSDGFSKHLSRGEQQLHLLAIALIGIAIALIMTPAATHRQLDIREVTLPFIRLSTRLLLLSMAPLATALCIDFYLVARVIDGAPTARWFAGGLLLVFALLWWVLPRLLQHRLRRGDRAA